MIELLEKIRNICCMTAEKLGDPRFVIDISTSRDNLFFEKHFIPWDSTTLGYGFPALIVLFNEIDFFFPARRWKKICENYADLLLEEIKLKGFHDPSLFGGLAGICYSIQLIAKQQPKYTKIHTELHNLLLKQINEYYLRPIESAEKKGDLPTPIQYGVVSGLNGLLTYLLNYKSHDPTRHIIDQILRHIVRICRVIRIGKHELPGWYALGNYLLTAKSVKLCEKAIIDEHLHLYEDGCFDTGMIHGISGCLAVLSKTLMHGITVKGHIEAIGMIVNWLKQTKQNVGHTKQVWPKRFAFSPNKTNNIELRSEVYFDSWSYGAPGILNSMFLAANSLQDLNLYDYCVANMSLTASRLNTSKKFECSSFFYGRAGNLAIMHQMYLTTKLDIFSQTTAQIARSFIDEYNERYPFGFKCSVPSNDLDDSSVIDNAGLVTGVTGILLSLLFYTSDIHRPWTQLFILN